MSTPEAATTCTPWITADDLAATCESAGTDASVLDEAAQVASDILYVTSGRKYPGVCDPVTVRPCNCTVCPPDSCCSCCGLSRVWLLGHVWTVDEVTIDGDVVPPTEYRLDSHRWLTRLPVAGSRVRQVWPGCQRLDLDATETDTFAVTYTYGQVPPAAGVLAAQELGCQIAAAAQGGECALPAGAVKVTRQGIEVDLQQVASAMLSLPLVGMFLSAYNPSGQKRKTGLWSPDLPAAPRVLG